MFPEGCLSSAHSSVPSLVGQEASPPRDLSHKVTQIASVLLSAVINLADSDDSFVPLAHSVMLVLREGGGKMTPQLDVPE